jgi:hypothetical protein
MLRLELFSHNDQRLQQFMKFADNLYVDDPYYQNTPEIKISVPATFFLTLEKDKPQARAALIENPHLQYSKHTPALLGYYEATDNPEATTFLFQQIEKYARQKDYTYLLGPLNASTWYSYRLTEPDTRPPFFLDNYHKPWYTRQFRENGFKPITTYYSASLFKENFKPRPLSYQKVLLNRNIQIRSIDIENFDHDLYQIYRLTLDAFRYNFLYTPIEFSEFLELYRPVKNYLNTDYSLLAFDAKGKLISFLFSVDNIFDKTKKALILKTLANSSDIKAKGTATILTEIVHRQAFESGYDEVIHALMHKNNISRNISAKNATTFRHYTLFGKDLCH